MRTIVTTRALAAEMAAATDEQLRLLQLYGKPFAVRAAKREAAKRGSVECANPNHGYFIRHGVPCGCAVR